MFVPVQNLAWLIYPFYCFIRIFRSFVLWFKRTFEEMCFTVQLSMFFAVSATAFIFYHVVFALSRTFLTFLKKFFSSLSPQATLIFYHAVLSLSRTFFIFSKEVFSVLFLRHSFVRISLFSLDVKNFFSSFFHRTEKEGFEPSRRY